jgi:hypothetical protein
MMRELLEALLLLSERQELETSIPQQPDIVAL